MRKTKWTSSHFSSVHWDSFERAFRRLTCQKRINTSKLIFNLANTNKQNSLYYDISPICPGCKAAEETFEHVLICPFPPIQEYRNSQLSELEHTLATLDTPTPVISTIRQGFQDWVQPPAHRSRAPTFGSLHGPDVLLTQTYYEQYYQLSWYQFCLGRISKNWAKTIQAYDTTASKTRDTEYWASFVVSALWKLTTNMWKHCNQIVHGATAEENATIIRNQLHAIVTAHFSAYADSQDYGLPRHSYLFTQCTLEQCLQYSHDSIKCWIRSVEEARAILTHQQDHLRTTSLRMFDNFQLTSNSSNEAVTPDTPYTPSTPSSSLDAVEKVTNISSSNSNTSVTLSSNDQLLTLA
jgi:hypothetical protein